MIKEKDKQIAELASRRIINKSTEIVSIKILRVGHNHSGNFADVQMETTFSVEGGMHEARIYVDDTCNFLLRDPPSVDYT